MRYCVMNKLLSSFIFLILILSGCGVEMEDVKKELMPSIQRNTDIIDSMKKVQDVSFTKISDNVLYMEKDLSKIRDRIKALQLFVEREVAEQNEYLAKMADKEYESLERETEFLEMQLKELQKLMAVVKAKKTTTNNRVKENEEPVTTSEPKSDPVIKALDNNKDKAKKPNNN